MTTVILVAISVALILSARGDERRDIEVNAEAFSRLTTEPVCVAYDTYFDSGRGKFLEIVRDVTRLSADLERFRLFAVNGEILFDSITLADDSGTATSEPFGAPPRSEALLGLETTFVPDAGGDGQAFEVYTPFVEDWGAHRMTVVYTFSYQNLRPRVLRRLATSGGFILLAILASLAVGIAATSRITRPLEQLTESARALARGQFESPLEIQAKDEVRVLADAFNTMARELEDNLRRLEDSKQKLEVMQNLLENAVKYMGEQPSPHIEVGVRHDGGRRVVFVRDNGVGIPAAYHERIFGLFQRLQTDSEGTGVGLALVERIVDLHGGEVWVESDGTGQGSTFCFVLPEGGYDEAAPGATASPPPTGDRVGCRAAPLR